MDGTCAVILSPGSTGPGMSEQHSGRSLGPENLSERIVLPALLFLWHMICLVRSTLPIFFPFLPPAILRVLPSPPLSLSSMFSSSPLQLNSNWDSSSGAPASLDNRPGRLMGGASSTCSSGSHLSAEAVHSHVQGDSGDKHQRLTGCRNVPRWRCKMFLSRFHLHETEGTPCLASLAPCSVLAVQVVPGRISQTQDRGCGCTLGGP